MKMRYLFCNHIFACLLCVLVIDPAFAGSWPPSVQDARSMLAADRDAFLDFMGAIEKEGPFRVQVPDGPLEKLAADDKDPGLVDMAVYREFINLFPDAPEVVDAYLERALFFLDRGLPDLAIREVRLALEHDQNNQTAWYYWGRAHELKGELTEAQANYQQAILLDPKTEVGIEAGWRRQMTEFAPRDDRGAVIASLGNPDSFTISMFAIAPGKDQMVRYETWYYYRARTVFEFLNGDVLAIEYITGEDATVAEAILPPYSPYQFIPGLDFESVADIIGQEYFMFYELGDDPLEDGELVYTRQTALGFKQGGLFYVRTFPFFTDQ